MIISLPLILFSVILINFLPLIIPNAMGKESFSVGNLQILICFFIEIIILGIWFIKYFIKNNKRINLTKEVKINFILLIISTIILFSTQVLNFINKEFVFMDILNIGCIFINIFFFYICVMNIKIQEKNIFTFFKLIVCFTTVSTIVSIFIYHKEIYELLVNGKYSWDITVKSFFANRNTYAFILYLGIIADMFVINNNKSILYKLLIPLFLFSLYTTSSRTGIALGFFLIGIMFLFSNKVNWKIKITLISLFVIIGCIVLVYLYNDKELWNKINSTILRVHEIKNISGRTDIWEKGVNILKENPKNLILGVGRFNSIQSLVNVGKNNPKNFTQFHNIYIDILTTGGIIELAYVLSIYLYIILKIFKSNIDKKYKNLYKAMFITYAIYITLESFGRFSIGSSDTICLIFFVTIPLLHANSIKN